LGYLIFARTSSGWKGKGSLTLWMDEQTPPATEPAPPQNPLSQLLIQLSRIFAAVPQTSEDARNAYIMALVEMARFVREAARSTQDMGLWEAQLRLYELA
jgi:hypothetical protein